MASPASSPYPVPTPVPPPNPQQIAPGITLLAPQSRKGTGPGIILLTPDVAREVTIENGIPSPSVKWAEEGYCIVQAVKEAWDHTANALEIAVDALRNLDANDSKSVVGLVCYDQSLWELATPSFQKAGITAAVLYTSSPSSEKLSPGQAPVLLHVSGKDSVKPAKVTSYHYPAESSHLFATPFTAEFNYAAEAVSHTRNLTFLKKHMGGPYFDLETLWDEHTFYEFGNRSVENTMNTMVQEPYVNHIPTMTGGIGRDDLSKFYRDHFIFSNPADAELELISRTVGVDRVVDEFIFKCTHNQTIDWLLPGVPPTNRYIEIPMMAVVNIRGDRLYHEHIHWDSASALKQVDLLPEHAAMPSGAAPVKVNGSGPAENSSNVKLPAYGKEAAAKMRDKNSVPSNEFLGWTV